MPLLNLLVSTLVKAPAGRLPSDAVCWFKSMASVLPLLEPLTNKVPALAPLPATSLGTAAAPVVKVITISVRGTTDTRSGLYGTPIIADAVAQDRGRLRSNLYWAAVQPLD
jgi:hypothetical protein